MSELIKRLLAEGTDLSDCAVDRIEQLERERERLALAICGGEDAPGYANAQTVEALEKVARDNAAWATWQADQAVQAQAKLAKAVETLEQITTIICSAVQGDNEHGVRSLNEIAAKNYLKDFPLTLAAITEVQDVIDAALAELEKAK